MSLRGDPVVFERIGIMRKAMFIVLVAVPVLLAASVEIGSSQFMSTKPFCGD